MDVLFALILLLQSLFQAGGHDETTQVGMIRAMLAGAHQWREAGVEVPAGRTAGQPGKQPGREADPAPDPQPDAPRIRGIYVTAYSAGGSRMESLLKLVDRTDLNAMVIDIKDDYGYITFKSDHPDLARYGATKPFIKDIGALMETLRRHDIYPIARIVVFKDSYLAKQRPDLSFVQPDGTVWANGNGDRFVNPYIKEIWDYNVAVAKEAARLGFKEIQFDYVRFPEGFEKRADQLKYKRTEESRTDVIAGFVEYARRQLNPLGVRVSVDIFGYAASVPAAEGIGQDFVKISEHVDVISPMVYPSHYGPGWFKQKAPDKAPYATVKGAMEDTLKKLEALGDRKPIIRPWIQDFTAKWLGKGNYIPYGVKEVEAQIRALADSGVDEFLLWNAGNRYTEGVNYTLADKGKTP